MLPGDLFLVPAGEHGFPLLVRVPPIPNNMRHRSVVRVLSVRVPSVAAPTSTEAQALHSANEIVVVSPQPAVLSSVADGDVVAVAITTSDSRVVFARVPLNAIQNGTFEAEVPNAAVRRGSGYFSLATIRSAAKLGSAACGVEWTECVLSAFCRAVLSALDRSSALVCTSTPGWCAQQQRRVVAAVAVLALVVPQQRRVVAAAAVHVGTHAAALSTLSRKTKAHRVVCSHASPALPPVGTTAPATSLTTRGTAAPSTKRAVLRTGEPSLRPPPTQRRRARHRRTRTSRPS